MGMGVVPAIDFFFRGLSFGLSFLILWGWGWFPQSIFFFRALGPLGIKGGVTL